jgi:hypothetical protein
MDEAAAAAKPSAGAGGGGGGGGGGGRQHWMESVRVVQANFLVYYHNMRFFDGKRNWLRVTPVPTIDDITAVRQYMVRPHSNFNFAISISLNFLILQIKNNNNKCGYF